MSWIVPDNSYPIQESWDINYVVPNEPLPNGIFYVDNDYPMFDTFQKDIVPTTPVPAGLFYVDNYYPMFHHWELSHIPDSPLPVGVFVTEHKYPKFLDWELSTLGAFNASSVELIETPRSLRTIGKYSFKDTPLPTITLPTSCTYYVTSFPEGCVVQGGTLIDD